MKTGAVFVDLTAAYDTVWHRGLACKLLRLIPDRHLVQMIMELVQNRSFTLTTGNGKQSRLRCLKNGVPQRSVPLLFSLISMSVTCHQPLPANLLMPMISHSCILLEIGGLWRRLLAKTWHLYICTFKNGD